MPDPLTSKSRAWKTRRQKYGPRGHGSSYRRWPPLGSSLTSRALKLITQLHVDGTLSEGQCCKAINLGRVEFREMVDAWGGAYG